MYLDVAEIGKGTGVSIFEIQDFQDKFVIGQIQIIPNDSQWRISETVWHRSISEI